MIISVISMIKYPHNFMTWLKYHKLFVSKFYFIFDHKLDSDEFRVLEKRQNIIWRIQRDGMVPSNSAPSKQSDTTKYTEISSSKVMRERSHKGDTQRERSSSS